MVEPSQWLGVYQLAIRAAGGDDYVMANYLPLVLAPNVLTWLMGLPSCSIDTWEELCRQLINNFKSTCNRPSSEWDLNRMKQREGEPLRDYIQRFCHKRNSIPNIEERAMIMYFTQGLRDMTLFHKLTRKDVRTGQQLFKFLTSSPRQKKQSQRLGKKKGREAKLPRPDRVIQRPRQEEKV